MFKSARLKIERAKSHINDLQARSQAFVRENPYILRVDENPKTGQGDVQVVFKTRDRASKFLAPIIGDAIHNLHCALDHITWEFVGLDGGTQSRYLKFPTGKDRTDYEASCQGIDTPSQSVRDLFKSLEAFPSGKGDSLYSLHLLDNADKHTVLTPLFRLVQLPNYTVVGPDNSFITNRRGSFWATGDTGAMFLDQPEIPVGSMIKIAEDAEPTFDIFIHAVEGVPMQPILPTLSRFREKVEETLDIIEQSIVSNGV